ncbi:MAG: hypothetical protein QM638_00605 [Nocardioides sp.]
MVLAAVAVAVVVAAGADGIGVARSNSRAGTATDATARAGAAAAGSLNAPMTSDEVPQTPHFGVNARGQTYGAIPDHGMAEPASTWPDLVAMYIPGAEGDADVGYVYSDDIDDADRPQPRTPAEALARQSANAGTRITIYAADGVTVVGYFVPSTGRPGDATRPTEAAD